MTSRSYTKAHYGCECFYKDSHFKRFNRMRGGDVVNFNNVNIWGGNCCGNSCGGSIWTGVGIALLGNFFGGGFNPLGGIFGNGLFGGGTPWSNNIGNVADEQTKNEKATTKTRTERNVEEKLNKDYPKAIDFLDKIKELQNKKAAGTLTQDDIDALTKEIDDARENLADDVDSQNDVKAFDRIKKLIPTLGGQVTPTPVTEVPPSKTEELDKLPQAEQDALKKTGIPEAEIENLLKSGVTPDEIVALSKLGFNAGDIKGLHDLGVTTVKFNGKGGELTGLSLPKEHTADALNKLNAIIGNKNIAVAVANNTKSGEDNWIAGKIGDINEDTDGKLHYTVNCDNYGLYEYKYSVDQKEGSTYVINLHADSFEEMQEDGRGNRAQDFELEAKLLRRNGASVISQWY